MRKLTALIGSCLFFLVMVTLYLMLDTAGSGIDHEKFMREVGYIVMILLNYCLPSNKVISFLELSRTIFLNFQHFSIFGYLLHSQALCSEFMN